MRKGKLVECVPNFSEGRRTEVLEGIAAVFNKTKGISLLDYSADADHNRSVYTLAGEAQAMVEAMFDAVSYAQDHIDLREHLGRHPRIGAVDVIPFIPLNDVSMEECVRLARQLGRRMGEELEIPVFLYEEAATTPLRRNLADVRRGGFEALAQKMETIDGRPDFGPAKPHPSFGASAVGARYFLIAYNINLATCDLEIARKIAQKIRFSSGGFPNVKALGLLLEEQGLAQVSVNMTDFNTTSLWQVFDAVSTEAALYGVEIKNSEIIGLCPTKALTDCAIHYLRLEGFDDNRILENRLQLQILK